MGVGIHNHTRRWPRLSREQVDDGVTLLPEDMRERVTQIKHRRDYHLMDEPEYVDEIMVLIKEARIEGLDMAWREVACVTEGKPSRVAKCLQVIEEKRRALQLPSKEQK